MPLFRKKKKESDPLIPKTIAPMKNANKNYLVGNLQGVGARERQEDAFAFANVLDSEAVQEKGMLLVVCDGMGGMRDGKIASETAVSYIRNAFSNMDMNGDISQQLKKGVYEASKTIEELLGGDGGSTVVACIIYKNELYYASVGDSFLYLKRGEYIYRINCEHNVCNQIYLECVRKGNMDPFIGKEDPESNALSQFLGMTGMNQVDGFTRPLMLKGNDVIIACSDGVGGVLDENEMLEALSYDVPDQMCHMLEEKIIQHKLRNQDNYTALIVKCVG